MIQKRFTSITHLHIFAAINTLIEYRLNKKNIRLLDIGCGNGAMIITLASELTSRYPDFTFEFFGIDVDDSHVQQSGFFNKTISMLSLTMPEVEWSERLKLVGSGEQWPFPDEYFDILYSNQVFEHVANHKFTFLQIRRTMTENGWCLNLFPLSHYILEGHISIPFAHKFNSWTTTYHWIKWASHLRIGTYHIHKKKGICPTIHNYSIRHADYMAYQVNYKSTKEISRIAKNCRLKPSFDFSYLYYKQKMRSILKLKPLEIYPEFDISSAKNSFYFLFLRYISGITLILRKRDVY